MDVVDFLKGVSIFAHMKPRDLKRFSRQVQSLQYQKGDVIIREGEKGSRLFIIVNGKVEAVKGLDGGNPQLLYSFGPRSYFGEMALWDDMIRTASVVAARDTQVLYLDRFDFRNAIEKYPGLAIELLQMLNRRIRALEKKVSECGGEHFMRCSKCGKIRLEDGSWMPLENYIANHSHSDIAEICCDACIG